MKRIRLSANTLIWSCCNFTLRRNSYFSFALIAAAGMGPSLYAQTFQQIIINPRSNIVLYGNVNLVVNDAAFQNNGTFTAGSSTVNFSGNTDTTASYVTGSNSTIFNNLSVSKSAYGVALKSAVAVKNVLAVNAGNLYADSNLTLKSDVNLTARVDVIPSGSNIIGKVIVERYIPKRRAWRLLTAPVTSSNTIYDSWQNKGVYTAGWGTLITGPNPSAGAGNGLDYSVQNTVSLKWFNSATQQIVKVLNTKSPVSTGSAGRADNTGYFVFIRGDRDPANTIISNSNTTTLNSIGALQTGTQTFAASVDSGKYTLIGNPYASPVSFDNVTRTNLIKRFYVWDPSLNIVGGYVMLDDLDNDNVYSKSVAGSSQTKDIQSSQAFFVQTTINGTASLTFNETSKSGNSSNTMFRPVTPATQAGAGKIITTLNLLEPDNTTILADGVIAEFNNIYSAGVDLADAAKFSNTNENISIIRNNFSLAAERRPALNVNDTVYFRLTTATQRAYQFVFEVNGLQQPGIHGFLEDSYLKTSTPIALSGNTSINFTINKEAASADVNRFRIVFKSTAVISPVYITSVKAYPKNNDIQVEWKEEREVDMVKYDVEKSINGYLFTPVHTTAATAINNPGDSYGWLDANSVAGNNFYRIKSYDISGKVRYSAVVKVVIEKRAPGFSVYPNPVTGNVINLLINNQPAGAYYIKLTNNTGQVLLEKIAQNNGGNSPEQINTGSKLPAGIYQLEITGPDKNHHTQKVVVE